MPINDKQQAFINEYLVNGHNATKAYKTAYPNSSDKACESSACDLLRKPKIVEEISRIQAKTGVEAGKTREGQVKRLDDLIDMAVKQGNVAGAKACIAEQDDLLGFRREAAPNKEMEQAILKRMSSEDKELARVTAMIRTDEEARKSIKIA